MKTDLGGKTVLLPPAGGIETELFGFPHFLYCLFMPTGGHSGKHPESPKRACLFASVVVPTRHPQTLRNLIPEPEK